MKLKQLLQENKLALSFEVFPPKKSSNYESIKAATEEIAALKPSFMSVTYGAGGSTDAYTLAIAENIMKKYSVPLLAHLSCLSSTKAGISQMLTSFKTAGIENILALRGDKINGQPYGEYRYAAELIADIKAYAPEICIGGACYPEVHPESPDQKMDILYLREKVAAGCDFLTTQMFFDNNLLYNFLYKIREAGITVPIIAGVMPITNGNQVARAIKLSGSLIPQRFKAIVDKFGHSPAAMEQAGIAYATDQVIDLYANGINNVHIYTMNKVNVAKTIQSNLCELLGKDF